MKLDHNMAFMLEIDTNMGEMNFFTLLSVIMSALRKIGLIRYNTIPSSYHKAP